MLDMQRCPTPMPSVRDHCSISRRSLTGSRPSSMATSDHLTTSPVATALRLDTVGKPYG